MTVQVHRVGEIGRELIVLKGLARVCYTCEKPILSVDDFVSAGSPRRYRHLTCAEKKNLVPSKTDVDVV